MRATHTIKIVSLGLLAAGLFSCSSSSSGDAAGPSPTPTPVTKGQLVSLVTDKPLVVSAATTQADVVTATQLTYQLTNPNSVPAKIDAINFGDRTDLAVAKTSSDCAVGESIPANGQCTLHVTYTPPSQADVDKVLFVDGKYVPHSFAQSVNLEVDATPFATSKKLVSTNSSLTTDLPTQSFTLSGPYYFQGSDNDGVAQYQLPTRSNLNSLYSVSGQFSDQYQPGDLKDNTLPGGTANLVFYKLTPKYTGTTYPAYDFNVPQGQVITTHAGNYGWLNALSKLPEAIKGYQFGDTAQVPAENISLCNQASSSSAVMPNSSCYIAYHSLLMVYAFNNLNVNNSVFAPSWSVKGTAITNPDAMLKISSAAVVFNTDPSAGTGAVYAMLPNTSGYVFAKMLTYPMTSGYSPFFVLFGGQTPQTGASITPKVIVANSANGLSIYQPKIQRDADNQYYYSWTSRPFWNTDYAGYKTLSLGLHALTTPSSVKGVYRAGIVVSWIGEKADGSQRVMGYFRANGLKFSNNLGQVVNVVPAANASMSQLGLQQGVSAELSGSGSYIAYATYLAQDSGLYSANVGMNATATDTGSIADVKPIIPGLTDISLAATGEAGGKVNPGLGYNNPLIVSGKDATGSTVFYMLTNGEQPKLICAMPAGYTLINKAFTTINGSLYFTAQDTSDGRHVLAVYPFAGQKTAGNCLADASNQFKPVLPTAAATETTMLTDIFQMHSCNGQMDCH